MTTTIMHMTPEELGSDLALSFQKFTITQIFKDCLKAVEEDESSWRFKIGLEATDKTEIAMEWIIFELFLFGQAILGYFKGNDVGKRVVKSLHETCTNDLIEHSIFGSFKDFASVLIQRYDYYLDTLKKAEPNNTMLLSKCLLDRISGGKGNIIFLPAMTSYYFDMTIAYEKLVREIVNEIHLVT